MIEFINKRESLRNLIFFLSACGLLFLFIYSVYTPYPAEIIVGETVFISFLLISYNYYLSRKYRFSSSHYILRREKDLDHLNFKAMIFQALFYICLFSFIAKTINSFTIYLLFIFSVYGIVSSFRFKKSVVFEYNGEVVTSIQNVPIYIQKTDKMIVFSRQSIKVMDQDENIQMLNKLDIVHNDIEIFVDWINDQLGENEILFFDTSKGEAVEINPKLIELEI